MAEVRYWLVMFAGVFFFNIRSLLQFVSARLYELRSQITAGKIRDDDERMSLLQRLLNYRPNSAFKEYMSDQDIISEGMGHTYV